MLPVLVDMQALLRYSDDSGGDYLVAMIVAWSVTYLAAAGVTVWHAVRRGDLATLRRGAAFTKLAGIPFFVMNFVILGVIVQSLLFVVDIVSSLVAAARARRVLAVGAPSPIPD